MRGYSIFDADDAVMCALDAIDKKTSYCLSPEDYQKLLAPVSNAAHKADLHTLYYVAGELISRSVYTKSSEERGHIHDLFRVLITGLVARETMPLADKSRIAEKMDANIAALTIDHTHKEAPDTADLRLLIQIYEDAIAARSGISRPSNPRSQNCG